MIRKPIVTELVLSILANQVLRAFGEMTIVRGVESGGSRKLVCISDDDGGALVWNSNLVWEYVPYKFSDRKDDMQFYAATPFNSIVRCKMRADDDCLLQWNAHLWSLTNSRITPMGPVFDQRWEEFTEFESFSGKYDDTGLVNATAALSFSVRAASDMHMLLCNGSQYLKNTCYWIIIGGWLNKKSVIRKCMNGVPEAGKFPPPRSPCAKERASFNHSPLSAVSWQSFVITWDSVTRNISVYDTDKVLMTYVDKEKSEDLNFDYHMFIKSPNPMLLRFHIYDFLQTTTERATLTSPDFTFNNKVICVQLLVGLCAECSADVILRDTRNGNVLENMSVEGSSTAYNLPTWQFVKIEKSLSTIGYTQVAIQIIPRLKSQNSNPLWAVADVRQCPPSESLRLGSMTAKQDWINYSNGYYWPVVTCQKLFYKKNTFVNSASHAKLKIELNDTVCSDDFIGPQCLISCSKRLKSDYTCTGTSVCYKNGCKCSPGFYGSECAYYCKWGTYSYDCEKKCGACTASVSCNKATGKCPTGCQYNKTKLYIPPLCRTVIDKPNTPAITAVTQTSIQAVVPMMWKDEYEKADIFYSFSIQKRGGVCDQQAWNKVFRNMTQLTEYFKNLQPATFYEIVCSLSIGASNKQKIDSDQKSVETTCDMTKTFEVTPEETVLKIDLRKSTDQIYPCPADWYRSEIRNMKSDVLVVDEPILQFPYESPRLLPYTTYKVTVYSKKGEALFSREVHTPEGTPSKVLDLQAEMLSNTRVILSWKVPEQPNGIIKQYYIILKVDEYSGCQDLGLSSPNNHITQRSTEDTSIAITQLHPYAHYSAQVIAQNSRHDSESAKTSFTTAKTEIPAATFSRFKAQDWKLSWSPPEDCTTILGPIYARVKIRGVSNIVRNFVKVITTAECFLVMNFLYGDEQYAATIYAVRDYSSAENSSAYQETEFKTPPKAPPEITNLDVVEVDTQRNEVHLRWQNPYPPFNGKLQKYIIYSCTANNRDCKPTNVKLDEYCDLWDNFICKVIPKSPNIQVVVTNENVLEPSVPAYVTQNMLTNTIPTAPRNYTVTIKDNSVVDLRWLHPWKTGDRLKYFHIAVEEVSSRRRASQSLKIETYEYTVTSYMREYSKRLYLLPFTRYKISIQSVTIAGRRSSVESARIQTPSTIDFHDDLKLTAQEYDTTVLLKIPSVLNDTSDSVLHVIVKGPNPCEQHTEVPADLSMQVGLSAYDVAWQAAVVSTPRLEGKVFTVGDNEIYGNGTNCLLKSGVLYEITVAVTGRNVSDALIVLTRSASIRIGEAPPRHHEAWLIPFVILLVVTGAALYFYRRRKQESIKRLMLQDEVILSPHIEYYEHEGMKAVKSNSKQGLSTPSDRQSLSRATTPEVPPISIENIDDEQKEASPSVKVKDFEDYVRQGIQSKLLDKQYETFPRGQTQPWDYGKLPQNKTKNRYGNLIAYDETRVVLTKHPDDDHSDYINANYITGYKQEKRYIATQGPKPNTVVDFWRMIWQEKVLIICMLANIVENGKTKCEQYWPDIGKKKKYGDVIVLNAKHNVFADYCFRTFHVTCKEETRKVEHLHYTAWPDHGVPLYTHSVVTYLKKLLATPPGNGPVVVHCSAGVGRTGTIVLCDICLHRAAAEGVVDVFAETASIRRERANMVDNKQQYLLAHLALVECLLSIPTTLPCNETLPVRIKEMKKKLSVQQQRLQNTAWQDEALRQVAPTLPLSERNRAKSRFPELILDRISRIYLKRYPPSDEDSDYLSAVYVDGVRLQNQYLATQLPMPSTINDFWRMIAEFKVELILALQPPDSADSTCCAIAPASGEFKPTPYLNVAVKEIVELETHTSQKLLLVDNSEKPSREQSVTVLCMKEWKPGRNQPPPPVISMVTFWQAAERVSRGDGPTVTLCHDGVTGCGLYLALSFLLERMAVERECDVCLAVRAVRRSRPDFVRSLEYLEYLYDAATAYLEYFETYANFS